MKLKGDRVTDPGAPSYSQPFRNIYSIPRNEEFPPNGLQPSIYSAKQCLFQRRAQVMPTARSSGTQPGPPWRQTTGRGCVLPAAMELSDRTLRHSQREG